MNLSERSVCAATDRSRNRLFSLRVHKDTMIDLITDLCASTCQLRLAIQVVDYMIPYIQDSGYISIC